MKKSIYLILKSFSKVKEILTYTQCYNAIKYTTLLTTFLYVFVQLCWVRWYYLSLVILYVYSSNTSQVTFM